MNWSPQQERALDHVGKWLKTFRKPYLTLAGYAGTGKTTLAKHLTAGIDGQVFFAAFTGKAAHVLMKSGVQNASTIHKLIYLPRDKCGSHLTDLKHRRDQLQKKRPVPLDAVTKLDKQIQIEQENLSRPEFTLNYDSPLLEAELLVIDEYSMVDEQMGRDLLHFKCPILALGDPGQLPPVHGRQFFTAKPDIMLDEIHRQAADNPIIRMSRDVREGRRLAPGNYGQSRVVRQADVSDAELGPMVLAADQLLVGMNITRRQFNVYTRGLLGITDPLPVGGDKIVCRRNVSNVGLLNGQMWTVDKAGRKGKLLQLEAHGEEGEKLKCMAHRQRFEGRDSALDELDPRVRRLACEFDYGYALTVHTSQGSQWGKVLLLDEWHGSNRKEWLYTGITRAAESVTVVQ